MLTENEKTIICMIVAENPAIKEQLEADDALAREQISAFKEQKIEGLTTHINALQSLINKAQTQLSILSAES